MPAIRMTTLVATTGLLVCAHTVSAGPLTPPGVPTPTMKTLVEVEPRTIVNETNTPPLVLTNYLISEPGSYYLTGDINVTAPYTRGITIRADGVTLDLNGFTIRGDGVNTTFGILVDSSSDGLTIDIKNGYIERFTDSGIATVASDILLDATDISVWACGFGFNLIGPGTLTDCVVSECASRGFLTFREMTFIRCSAYDNGSTGFDTSLGGIFKNCVSRNNGGNGFSINEANLNQQNALGVFINCSATLNYIGYMTYEPATFDSCVAINNDSTGFLAIVNASVDNCNAEGNGQLGFSLGNGSSIMNSSARDNVSTGISLAQEGTITGCSSYSNEFGINIGARGSILNSSAVFNTLDGIIAGNSCSISGTTASLNGAEGIDAANYAVIDSCTANNNTLDGINTAAASSITNCSANSNDQDGIQVSSDTRVSNCNADGNAGTGIVGSSDVTIDSCTVTDNAIGIAGGAGGLVIRCSAAGNTTNYNMTNARYGAIITPAVGSFTTTNAFANIEY